MWIIVSDYGLSPSNFFSNHDSSCICLYPSLPHVLTHLKSPAFLYHSLSTICYELIYTLWIKGRGCNFQMNLTNFYLFFRIDLIWDWINKASGHLVTAIVEFTRANFSSSSMSLIQDWEEICGCTRGTYLFDLVKDVDVPSVHQQKGGICMDHVFVRFIVQPW